MSRLSLAQTTIGKPKTVNLIDLPVPPTFGLCHCGCGQKTKLAPYSNATAGWKKGEPLRFISRHHPRRNTPIAIRVEDRGYKTKCWIWLRRINDSGYGLATRNGKEKQRAHRVVYEMVKGKIPVGLTLDHLCRVRCCVNPSHLEPVTTGVNTRRGSVTRLTAGDVQQIRQLHADGIPYADLARQFGVCAEHISNICEKKKWSTV